MAESERRPELPTVLIVVLALLGVTTFRGGALRLPEPKLSPASAGLPDPAGPSLSRGPGAGDPSSDRTAQVLHPLAVHFGWKGEQPLTAKSVYEQIKRNRADHPGRESRNESGIKCLIAMVPDPVRTSNGHRFDESLDAIQRGVESEDYLLAGYRIPWHEDTAQSMSSAEGEAVKQAGAGKAPPRLHFRMVAPPPQLRQPGVIVFRSSQGNGDLLLVLLVPESPTLGLDKECLVECLKLAQGWDRRNYERGPGNHSGGKEQYNILGPCFSGSQTTFEQALRQWLQECGGSIPVQLEVISGMASGIDPGRLAGAVPGHRLRFHATVHRTEAVLNALLHYLGAGAENREPIALLTESDTGFGQSLDSAGFTHGLNLATYVFPSHISQLRSSYEKQGVLGDAESQTIRSAESLAVPLDESGPAEDIISPMTPGYTAAVDELIVDQILTDIAHRKIRRVGIIATDPRDVIFLAREVNRFCVDVQLFTPLNNLLFARPQYAADLRGMLVGTTYLLYPRNQFWSDSASSGRRETPHVYFASHESQGTYNATLAQLIELEIGGRWPPHFLEYTIPFNQGVSPLDPVDRRIPPIWLGVVGHRKIYPVSANIVKITQNANEISDYDYLYKNKFVLIHDRSDSDNIYRFLPRPGAFWVVLFLGLTLAGWGLSIVALIASYWAWTAKPGSEPTSYKLCGISLRGLAEFLNLRRLQPLEPHRDPIRGPRLNICYTLFILLIIYINSFRRYVISVFWIGWQWDWHHAMLFGFAYLARATFALLSFALVFSFLAFLLERRPIRVRSGPRVRRTVVQIALGIIIFALLGWGRFSPGGFIFGTGAVRDWRDRIFMIERSLQVASGVSSVFPMFFLFVAGFALIFNRLNDLYLLEQFMPQELNLTDDCLGVDDPTWETDRKLQEERRKFTASVKQVMRFLIPRSGSHFVTVVLACLYLGYFVLPLLAWALEPSPRLSFMDGKIYNICILILISILFTLITINTIRLTLMWKSLRRIMKLFLQLPLGQSLELMSTRVARWFFESPDSGRSRFDLIQRQARTLAEHTPKEVWPGGDVTIDELGVKWQRIRSSLINQLPAADRAKAETDWEETWGKTPEDTWSSLKRNLESVDAASVAEVRAMLFPVVLVYWKNLSVTEAYPDVGDARAETVRDSKLFAWGRAAVDFLSLLLVSWIAVAMAQIWKRIGCLVLASLALLLAIDSYPFPFQDHVILGTGLLITYLIVVIVQIVLGVNREELISRIANKPHGMKLDTNLVSSMLSYIVPLVGVLAALSFNASDALHTLLDPLLRYIR